MNISCELSHIVLFQYCSHSDSRPLKQWKIWIMFKNVTIHHYSRHFLGVIFSFRKRYKHEKNKILVKKSHFYKFSQGTSDCHFLGSLFSFRKRYNHENNENMVNSSHLYHFSQATSNYHFLGSLCYFKNSKKSWKYD